ncbi:MAG: hypothetical protein GY838_15680 [bacterium]|nr:hypothetical protein [bacterium]
MKKLIGLLIVGLTTVFLLPVAGCGGDDGGDDPLSPGDTSEPGAVADLRVASIAGTVVTLAWTAPGDDGATGTAAEYDIRYSGAPITAANWAAASQIGSEPDPAAPGTEQGMAIDPGVDGDYYFALKTADEVPNWSNLSNVVTTSLGDVAFVVHQLTSDGQNIHPCLDDGYVVWIRTVTGEGNEIYISNLDSAFPALTRLTDNGGEKLRPNNHGAERIVWEGRGGPGIDWEIFVYNRYSVPRFEQFTDNVVDDRYPDLCGGGDFVWLHGPTIHEEVRYWNESAHSESLISDSCCPAADWNNDFLSAEDGAVVWRSYDLYGGTGHRTYLWDGSLTDLTDTLDATMATAYSLYQGTIGYVHGTGPARITYWDGTTVHDVGSGYAPSLYDGAIAYEVWDGHDWEIRYWDGTAIHEITDNDFNDTQASLDGSKIAWVGRPAGGGDQIFWVSVVE